MTKQTHKPVKFSKREKQVLKMLLEEKNSHEISKELNLSDKTVGTFKLRLLAKSGCKTIVGLYRFNAINNIVELQESEIKKI